MGALSEFLQGAGSIFRAHEPEECTGHEDHEADSCELTVSDITQDDD